HDGAIRSISARALPMPGRTDQSFPPETRRPSSRCSARRGSRSSPRTGVTTPTAGTTAHLLTAVVDDQGVEPALSVVMGDCPLPSCVTLVVRGLRTHAGHPKSCDHIS